jgi:hypothetical protein
MQFDHLTTTLVAYRTQRRYRRKHIVTFFICIQYEADDINKCHQDNYRFGHKGECELLHRIYRDVQEMCKFFK